VRIKVARIFNTYGPGMHPNDGRVISNFVVQALKGEPLTVYGDGNQTRSFCYRDDLIDALVRLMDSPEPLTGPINLGNPSEITVGELAETIVRMTGSPSRIVVKPLPVDDPLQRCPDITMAREQLGWQPQVDLLDGLRRTIAYFDALLREESSGESGKPVRRSGGRAEREKVVHRGVEPWRPRQHLGVSAEE
jgi:UDP-glucuronate decarboxylase